MVNFNAGAEVEQMKPLTYWRRAWRSQIQVQRMFQSSAHWHSLPVFADFKPVRDHRQVQNTYGNRFYIQVRSGLPSCLLAFNECVLLLRLLCGRSTRFRFKAKPEPLGVVRSMETQTQLWMWWVAQELIS